VTVCAHNVIGALRIYLVGLDSGNKPRFQFLRGCFSCHFSVEVQGNTLHIWPPLSIYLCSNTKMIFRQSYSILSNSFKGYWRVYVKEMSINGNIVRADCK
jgi:hypothetical protein